jgi:hypothetical protein
MSEIYDRIKQDIQQDVYYSQNFANAGERFLAWYLRNIYLRTAVQARDDITDGQDDKEIDAVIVDDELRRIVIIQGKFYAGSVDHQPLQDVLAAWIQIKDLVTLQQNANSKVKVKLAAVAEALSDDYDVEFELVTTGTLTTSAQQDLATFQVLISGFDQMQASITLVDEPVIKSRWEEAVAKELPKLNHTLTLETGRYLDMTVAGFKTVLAAVPLSDCLQLPGIRDGMLFRKNVRQSLGLTNKVNKGLRQTINSENPQYFFLFHNGITALCEKLDLDKTTGMMKLEGLSVVNGCQSLTTIMASSEKVRTSNGSYVLFRFYEIPQRDVAEKISVNTNSQSAVKPRDLRSNDKRVLALKRAYENTYKDGFFITKRGEERPADRDKLKTIEIGVLARCLISWHCQRPNISYNENKLFDKYFEQLFRSDYSPADLFTLNSWANHIERRWNKNDLGLNEALLAMPSYSKFHLLFAVQACFSIGSGQADKVPAPSATSKITANADTVDPIITMAANCYNSAFDTARSEYQERDKVFSPPNWLKAKDSVLKIQAASNMYLGMVKNMPGGTELKNSLVLPADKFMLRWTAD